MNRFNREPREFNREPYRGPYREPIYEEYMEPIHNIDCRKINRIVNDYVRTRKAINKIKFLLETNPEDLLNRIPELRILFNTNEETDLFLDIVKYRKQVLEHIQKGFYKDYVLYEIDLSNKEDKVN